jgi:hypothetical protein
MEARIVAGHFLLEAHAPEAAPLMLDLNSAHPTRERIVVPPPVALRAPTSPKFVLGAPRLRANGGGARRAITRTIPTALGHAADQRVARRIAAKAAYAPYRAPWRWEVIR